MASEGAATPRPEKPTAVENRQLDFLLADFKALKEEIGRRSGLQRLAFALYLAWTAAIWASVLGGKNLTVAVAGLSMGGVLALLFWYREHLEIERLGLLIRRRVAVKASAILSVPPADLIPSEAAQTVDEAMDETTHRCHIAFMWLVYFITPLILVLYVLSQRFDHLPRLWTCNAPTPYLALVILGCGAASLWLLVALTRHRAPQGSGTLVSSGVSAESLAADRHSGIIRLSGLTLNFVGSGLVGIAGYCGLVAGYGRPIVWVSRLWLLMWLGGWSLLALGFVLQWLDEVQARWHQRYESRC